MPFSVRRHRISPAVILAILLAPLGGCGGGEVEAPSETPARQVDPRFTSAEALIDYYNELTVRSPTVNPEAVNDLLYGEGEQQERLVGVMRDMVPYLELQHAVWEQFGEGLTAAEKTSPLAPYLKPARITEHTGQRAQAIEFEPDGTEVTLHLVQIGDRWWISAYSLEYDPRFDGAYDRLDVLERNVRRLSSLAPTVTAGVKAGQFASVTEVRAALGMRPQ